MKQPEIFDRFFRDSSGRVVLAQRPNLVILAAFVFMILTRVFKDSSAEQVFSLLSFGTLFTWAWLEIFSGVNHFRKLLGAVVMLLILLSRL